MAIPTNLAKTARMTGQRDQLNGGSLVLLRADGAVLATFALNTPAGSVAGAGILTFAGFPKNASAVAVGDVDRAELRTSGGTVSEQLTAGLVGSDADVEVSTTTVEQVGQVLTVAASPTLTHPA